MNRKETAPHSGCFTKDRHGTIAFLFLVPCHFFSETLNELDGAYGPFRSNLEAKAVSGEKHKTKQCQLSKSGSIIFWCQPILRQLAGKYWVTGFFTTLSSFVLVFVALMLYLCSSCTMRPQKRLNVRGMRMWGDTSISTFWTNFHWVFHFKTPGIHWWCECKSLASPPCSEDCPAATTTSEHDLL